MAGTAELGLEERVAKLEGRVEGFDGRFDALERRFDIVERRIDALGARIDVLDQKLDQKLTRHFHILATMMTGIFVAVVGGLIAGLFALR